MKLDHPLGSKLGGLLAASVVRAWMHTLDYKAAFYDWRVDPAHPDCRQQKIYIFWHEYILFPISVRGHCNLTMLLSRHRDAETLSRTAYHLGFDFVRGSTGRGGVAALRKLLRKSRQMHLTLTPDGPRGPRRRLAAGPIYLASKLGMPLVTLGFGYERPWRMNSWDRFAVPRPFSRARTVISPEIHVPSNLDRAGIEHFRTSVERLLNRLTEEAETWAESGTRKTEQFMFGRRYSALPSYIDHTPTVLQRPVAREPNRCHRVDKQHLSFNTNTIRESLLARSPATGKSGSPLHHPVAGDRANIDADETRTAWR